MNNLLHVLCAGLGVFAGILLTAFFLNGGIEEEDFSFALNATCAAALLQVYRRRLF